MLGSPIPEVVEEGGEATAVALKREINDESADRANETAARRIEHYLAMLKHR